MPDPRTSIELDVEQLMEIIQRRVNAQPDAKLILSRVEEIRRYADGIAESTRFNNDLTSRVKNLFYNCLMRVFRSNFERQRLFNHAVMDALQLIAEDMQKTQRMLPPDKDARPTLRDTER
ncbi:MAG TPA: hypothetical protein VLB68_23250 [Pyrinomonadaceae bacterium]|nr:hypothetical protein [Pyrinomonadaceae bacterium]